jgi:hypothetical protein
MSRFRTFDASLSCCADGGLSGSLFKALVNRKKACGRHGILQCREQPLELGQKQSDTPFELRQVFVGTNIWRFLIELFGQVFPTEYCMLAIAAHADINRDLALGFLSLSLPYFAGQVWRSPKGLQTYHYRR